MSDDIETPGGWEQRGPCFVREYGGKLAVLSIGLNGKGFAEFYEPGPNSERSGWLTLADAVNWANEQLGVPKPVVVVERAFADGSVLVWREDGKASARVSPFCGKQWFVDHADRDYLETKEQALTAAYEYVRGVQ